MIHLLDTGPLVSALAREEPRFGSWAKDLLRHLPRPLYTCEAVLTEVVEGARLESEAGQRYQPTPKRANTHALSDLGLPTYYWMCVRKPRCSSGFSA